MVTILPPFSPANCPDDSLLSVLLSVLVLFHAFKVGFVVAYHFRKCKFVFMLLVVFQFLQTA